MASQQTHHFTRRALMDIEGEFFDLRRFAMLNSMNQNFHAKTGTNLLIYASKAGKRVHLSRGQNVENFLARKDLRVLPSPLIVVERPWRRLLEGDVTSLSRAGGAGGL